MSAQSAKDIPSPEPRRPRAASSFSFFNFNSVKGADNVPPSAASLETNVVKTDLTARSRDSEDSNDDSQAQTLTSKVSFSNPLSARKSMSNAKSNHSISSVKQVTISDVKDQAFSDSDRDSEEEEEEQVAKPVITTRVSFLNPLSSRKSMNLTNTSSIAIDTSTAVISSSKSTTSPVKPTSQPLAVSATTANTGKEGWLYREIESGQFFRGTGGIGTQSKDNVSKVWVSLYNGMLFFSDHTKGSSTEIFSNTLCSGFMKLLPSSEVKIRYAIGDVKGASSNVEIGKKFYPFQVKEAENLSVVFSCESEGDRDEWVDVIKQAIAGKKHIIEHKTLILPSHKHFPSVAYHQGDITVTPTQAVDYPRKSGFLKKTSTGKTTFGVKSQHKRYFRLDAGELRYYEEENTKPSACKDIISLADTELQEKAANSFHITLSLANNTRQLKLEAINVKIAQEWKDCLSETFVLLSAQLIRARSRSDSNIGSTNTAVALSKRRFNLHDQVTQEERDAAAAAFHTSSRRSSTTTTPIKSPARNSILSRGTTPQDSPMLQTLNTSMADLHLHVNHGTQKTLLTMDLLKSALSQHFLLSKSLEIMPILDAMYEKTVVAGEVIQWQGSSGDVFYVLETGELEVLRDNTQHVCYMHPGRTFGDLSLMHNTTHQVTIRATHMSKLWCLSRSQYRNVSAKGEENSTSEKIKFLQQIELFSKLTVDSLETLAEVMTLKTYHNTDKIIRQGDAGDAFYMILSGRVSVSQSTLATGTVELVKLGPGKHFGELALIDDAPRKATVTATTPTVQCWTVDRVNFLNLFGSMSDAVKENMGITILKNVKILETLSQKQLVTIARALVETTFTEGEVIIKQGDVGDSFYLVASGEVSVQVNHMQVAVLTNGAFFGEMSLLSNERRSATVTAIVDTQCLVLSRADFDKFLGPLDEIIKAESRRRQEEASAASRKKADSSLLINRLRSISGSFFTTGSPKATRRSSVNKESNALFANTSSMFELHQLDKIKKLGVGTFGSVYLVQHSVTSKLYTMKVIHKNLLFEYKQENAIYNERDIVLSLVDCQHVTALYATMQDVKSVYMISQYVPGGDLYTLLYINKIPNSTKAGGVSMQHVVFYSAMLLSMITYMHDNDIVHRDLKPENLILDASGYLKLVDFGSAKKLLNSMKSNTLCGCPEYLSPEMVLSRGHNKAVDYWALGVFIYEMLTRSTPFGSHHVILTYQNILESDDIILTTVTNNSTLDVHSKSLLPALLHVNPNMRMGMLRNGLDDIWNHPFFKSVKREQIDNRSLTAPYIPVVDDESVCNVDHLDLIDMLEDVDDIPGYIGSYDFSSF